MPRGRGARARILGGRSGRIAGALAALAIAGLVTPVSTRASPPTEYQIKAAFLYNFARFVEWPRSTFPDSASPVVLGILGEDPFGDEIDQLVWGKTVDGRPLTVRRLQDVAQSNTC